MARLLEVSRSGFYAHLKREPSPRTVRAMRIEQKVRWFYGKSDEVSGAPRILTALREDGEIISRKTVAKTMHTIGLVGICPKKWKRTTLTNDRDTYPADLVKRSWDTGKLNQVWVSDITYLRTWQGWLYLAVVLDAHSRRVIGWAIDEHMRADLVEDALRMAIALRGELPSGVIFHADRGTQYASGQITKFADANGLTRSIGYTGVCWDNAMAESSFATLKTEFFHRRIWPTKKATKIAVGAWIEERYNRKRRHSSIGQIPPVSFEAQYPHQSKMIQNVA
jgi:transposase InsO family protein